jgi:hypothetical protein
MEHTRQLQRGHPVLSESVKYPDVEIQLSQEDGNGFMIVARVQKAIRRAHGSEAAKEYADDAMSGDYDNLLRVTAATVVVL